ncbi:MAG: hypothetical protein P8181_00815 [bacterium]
MTCKKIAKLLSERQDHELPLSKRLMITIHLKLCIFCRRLEHHLGVIHTLSDAIGSTEPGSPLDAESLFPGALSPEAKARIKQALVQYGQ